jgi:transcriptional regulator with XRE-family HTH domain
LTQHEIATKTGISQSRISRIEKGDKPKDIVMARKIAEAYSLTREETDQWLYLCFGIPASDPYAYTAHSLLVPSNIDTNLDEDLLVQMSEIAKSNLEHIDRRTFIKGLGWVFLTGPSGTGKAGTEPFKSLDLLLEAYNTHVHTAYEARVAGNPQLTINIVNSVSGQIQKLIRADTYVHERSAFLRVLADLYYQQGWAYSEISSHDKVWTQETGFAEHLKRIKKEQCDPSFLVLANIFLADGYYVAGQHDQALHYIAYALDAVQDPDHQLSLLLTQAKIWSRLQEKKRFEEASTKIVRLIDEDKISQMRSSIGVIHSNLARAQALLKMPDAFKSLEKAKDYSVRRRMEQTVSPLCEVQIARDELEVIKILDPTAHHQYLEGSGKNALRLAEQSKYNRLAKRVEHLLHELLG